MLYMTRIQKERFTDMAEYEAAVAPLKRRLFGELLGGLAGGGEGERSGTATLLELGMGTGPNMGLYAELLPPEKEAETLRLEIVGVDPNPQ